MNYYKVHGEGFAERRFHTLSEARSFRDMMHSNGHDPILTIVRIEDNEEETLFI